MTDNITTPDGGLMAIPDAIDVPGLMVAIFNRTGLLWSAVRGVRDAESGAPLDLSTWFPLGAITQTLTAMAIVGLRDAGALSLDDPISRHVPEALGFRYPTKDSAPITLRHLLTHTAGLSPGARELRKLFGDDPSEPDLLAHICSWRWRSCPARPAAIRILRSLFLAS